MQASFSFKFHVWYGDRASVFVVPSLPLLSRFLPKARFAKRAVGCLGCRKCCSDGEVSGLRELDLAPKARKEKYRRQHFLPEWPTNSHSAQPFSRRTGFHPETAGDLFRLEATIFLLPEKTAQAWMSW